VSRQNSLAEATANVHRFHPVNRFRLFTSYSQHLLALAFAFAERSIETTEKTRKKKFQRHENNFTGLHKLDKKIGACVAARPDFVVGKLR
jgi:hypothetical protein